METDNYRNQLIEAAASAYARGVIDQIQFETLVSQIQNQGDLPALSRVAADCPQVYGVSSGLVPSGPVIEDLTLHMSGLKKQGDWVRADIYRLGGNMSNWELDFQDYTNVTGFRLTLELDIRMSSVKLTVPDGWLVNVDISNNSMSEIKDKGPSSLWGDNQISLAGAMHMSNVKVKYK